MLQRAPRRRLKTFTEVVGLTKSRQSAPKVGRDYFAMSLPMRLSELEKWERLFEMIERVNAIKESDVILVGLRISPTVGQYVWVDPGEPVLRTFRLLVFSSMNKYWSAAP